MLLLLTEKYKRKLHSDWSEGEWSIILNPWDLVRCGRSGAPAFN